MDPEVTKPLLLGLPNMFSIPMRWASKQGWGDKYCTQTFCWEYFMEFTAWKHGILQNFARGLPENVFTKLNLTLIFYVAVNATTILSFLEDYKFLFDEIHTLHVSAYA
jgi:hypothetical protein